VITDYHRKMGQTFWSSLRGCP